MKSVGILEGIRVLDASTVLAAPLAANLLGDFGAEVIKIEQPKVGDPTRNWGSETWKVTGRNKKSVTLNLREEEGVDLFNKLVKKSDVVIVNYRPSTLKKWGIDYEDLIKVNENIIMLHLSAFGRHGPYSDRPGFARVAESFSGLTYMTGDADRKPMFSGYPIADAFGGVYGAFSIVLSIYHYKKTGEGQLIDMSLYDPLLRVMEDLIVNYDVQGKVAERVGSHNPRLAPNDMYVTKDERWIVIPASTENMFKRLVAAIGKPELVNDARFKTNELRVENRNDLDEYLNSVFSSHTLDELSELMNENGVAYGKVNSVVDILNDPHIKERGDLIKVYDAELGRDITMQGITPRFSKTPGSVKWVGPALGAHNEEIYGSLLEVGSNELQTLEDKGII